MIDSLKKVQFNQSSILQKIKLINQLGNSIFARFKKIPITFNFYHAE
jgi:uncharacterized protein YllA (UPF0747 family)